MMQKTSSATSTTGECLITDMAQALPREALSEHPAQDKWLVLDYGGPEVSGRMIWSPARSSPPDVRLPLPSLGRCKIYVGIYSSGTVPIWDNLFVPKGQWDPSSWHRVELCLEGDPYDSALQPVHYPGEQRFTHICERFWKTADLQGQPLVLRGPRKEAYQEAMRFVAYVRLVPDQSGGAAASGPSGDGYRYLDGNFFGHFVANERDVRSLLMPLAEEGCKTVFWNTSREDTCYYPTKVACPLPDHSTPGVYPLYAGRDMQRMLSTGLNPLTVACDVAHECGMELFGSYRRMTYRMPPFTYPMHPQALMARRPDLCCINAQGHRLPHLSLAQPEVVKRMLAIHGEQVNEYDVDGIHLFFVRGVPFVGYEQPFLDAFAEAHPGVDPRALPVGDERPWEVRGHFVTRYLRELRRVVDEAAQRRGRRIRIAIHVNHCVRLARFRGLDIPTIVREGLADILIPASSPYLPPVMADWPEVRDTIVTVPNMTIPLAAHAKPKHIEEFRQLAEGSGVEIFGPEATRQPYAPSTEGDGHRMVRVNTVNGFPIDHLEGLPTCG